MTCLPELSVREAAQRMSAERVNSIVVIDNDGNGLGIVTDWDLRERVVAAGRSLETPVSEVMSTPLATIDADRLLLEAVRMMIARRINHLVVTEEGKPFGMLTAFDLLVQQGTSALFWHGRSNVRREPSAWRRCWNTHSFSFFPFCFHAASGRRRSRNW